MTAAPVVTVIQARTGSSRLPAKVLLPLGGATVLERMLERVIRARRAGVVMVATTTARRDDQIEAAAHRAGVPCFRGHPEDLLDRHFQVARRLGAAHVVKIPSDCPLIDPAVIDAVIGVYLDELGAYDYVSNLHPPTYPDGNDVEIMSFDALAVAWRGAGESYEREHTTPFLWGHPESFRVKNVRWETGKDLSLSHRIVLDYAEDYEVIRRIFDALYPDDPLFSLDAIVSYLEANPDVRGLNSRHRGVSWHSRQTTLSHLTPQVSL